jgi:hypothetical protein
MSQRESDTTSSSSYLRCGLIGLGITVIACFSLTLFAVTFFSLVGR